MRVWWLEAGCEYERFSRESSLCLVVVCVCAGGQAVVGGAWAGSCVKGSVNVPFCASPPNPEVGAHASLLAAREFVNVIVDKPCT